MEGEKSQHTVPHQREDIVNKGTAVAEDKNNQLESWSAFVQSQWMALFIELESDVQWKSWYEDKDDDDDDDDKYDDGDDGRWLESG